MVSLNECAVSCLVSMSLCIMGSACAQFAERNVQCFDRKQSAAMHMARACVLRKFFFVTASRTCCKFSCFCPMMRSC
jgi:hypothetical protein